MFSTQEKTLKEAKLPQEVQLADMDAVLKKLDELKTEANKNHADLKAEIAKMNEEFQKAKIEWEKKAEEWRVEKVELGNRIKKLEEKIERQDRDKRRNNVVIKGVQIEGNQMEEKVEELLRDKLKIVAKVKKGYSVKGKDDKRIIIAEMDSWENKKEVMKMKGLLKDTNIFIENDQTYEERKIQAELRKIMKEEKEKGRKVKMGYQKIIIDEVRYDWDPIKQAIFKFQPKN